MGLTDRGASLQKRITEVACYSIFYLLAFRYVEGRHCPLHILNTPLDHYIPFCPVFVIPYLLWFVFVGVVLVWFIFRGEEGEYRALTRSLAAGCTLFIVISFVFPNVQLLRPEVTGDGVLEQLVRMIYAADTPSNVFPSIHVFNAVACCIAVLRSKQLQKKRLLRGFTCVLTVLIVLSTMFMKQHTILDVIGALLLNLHCYSVYNIDLPERIRAKVRRNPAL